MIHFNIFQGGIIHLKKTIFPPSSLSITIKAKHFSFLNGDYLNGGKVKEYLNICISIFLYICEMMVN